MTKLDFKIQFQRAIWKDEFKWDICQSQQTELQFSEVP